MSTPTHYVAVHLVVEHEGRLLMHRRKGTSYLQGYYSIPGGHVETGESCFTGLKRKIEQEIGWIIEEQDTVCALTLDRDNGEGRQYIDLYYVYRGPLQPISKADDTLHDHLDFYELEALAAEEPVIPYIKKALHAIHGGKTFETFTKTEYDA